MAYFSNNWHGPFRFRAGIDNINTIDNWGCQGKAGIYLIRNKYDNQTLYVGKAEATFSDIQYRLKAHLKEKSREVLQSKTPRCNRGMGDLVRHEQTFTIRWAESNNPALSESIAIVKLKPLWNKQAQWAINKAKITEIRAEVNRLGLHSPNYCHESLGYSHLEEKINAYLRQNPKVALLLNGEMQPTPSTLEEKLAIFEQQNPHLKSANIDYKSPSPSADIAQPRIRPTL